MRSNLEVRRSDPRQIVGLLAATVRHHPDDVDSITELRRDLREAQLAAYITRTVDAAPGLTIAQRDRLALLLRTPGGAAA